MAPVTVTAPGTSNRRPARATDPRPAAGESPTPRGMTRIAAISTSSATGAGTSSVHRQLTSVSSPDSTSPSEKPLAPNAEYTEIARLRIGPSWNVVVSRDSPAGAVNAAAMPLTNRAPISRPGLLTSPPNSEATANRPSANRKTRRRPSRSAARPPSSSRPP